MSYLDIPGWFDFQDIYREAVATAPHGATLVELGVAFGRSAAFLAREAIDRGRDDLTIVAVDPWVDDWTTPEGWEEHERPTWGADHAEWARAQGGPFSAFIVSMREHAPEELERLTVLRARSLDAAAIMRVHRRLAWMAFIDGDHRFEAVREDIEAWNAIVEPDGILAGHDYTSDFPGVRRAVAAAGLAVEVRGSSWVRRNRVGQNR